jgi:hypothetical protein
MPVTDARLLPQIPDQTCLATTHGGAKGTID